MGTRCTIAQEKAHQEQYQRDAYKQRCADITKRDKEIGRLRRLVTAAKHLLLAAHGPEDGPTSWNETRERWLQEAKARRKKP